MRQTQIGSEEPSYIQRIRAVIPYLSNNGWLKEIQWRFDQLLCLFTCEGEVKTIDRTVTTSRSIIRLPEPMAKKTVITNRGNYEVRLYEDGARIGSAWPNSSRDLPMNGQLVIEAEANHDTDITVTTFCRCACNKPEEYTSNEVVIGGHLL